MIILLDLDGTLTDTAHQKYKSMKDGVTQTIISQIPAFEGAEDFIINLKMRGHTPIIVSDSHSKYVKPIAEQIFKVAYVALTDKPNTRSITEYIMSDPILNESYVDKDNFIMVGDSWLDIELGRRLNIRTILTKFYTASEIEIT